MCQRSFCCIVKQLVVPKAVRNLLRHWEMLGQSWAIPNNVYPVLWNEYTHTIRPHSSPSSPSSFGENNGNPLQYSCLENPMDGGAWWAAVHGVAESWTWLSDFTFTFHFYALEKEMATHSQCSCLENPRDSGAWWAAVYGVTHSRTRLKRLSSSSSRSQFLESLEAYGREAPRERVYMCTYSWFTLFHSRNQHNVVKHLSSN